MTVGNRMRSKTWMVAGSSYAGGQPKMWSASVRRVGVTDDSRPVRVSRTRPRRQTKTDEDVGDPECQWRLCLWHGDGDLVMFGIVEVVDGTRDGCGNDARWTKWPRIDCD